MLGKGQMKNHVRILRTEMTDVELKSMVLL